MALNKIKKYFNNIYTECISINLCTIIGMSIQMPNIIKYDLYKM